MIRVSVLVALVLALALGARVAAAEPAVLAALAPPPGDDARLAVALGPSGEVYEPDGKGAWLRKKRFSTATTIERAARAGGAVVALGDGVVYKLADNGWSAIRLVQKGKALMSDGTHAVAAVGKQLFALDRTAAGEPAKLALAPQPVLAIGAGATAVVATDRGLVRVDNGKLVPLTSPRRANRLVGDRWALVDRTIIELATGKVTAWPAGITLSDAVAETTDAALAAVGTAGGKLELLIVRAGKVERDTLGIVPTGVAVGVAVDKRGRAVVALRDGRLAIRDGAVWTVATVSEALPTARPGPAPATQQP